MAANFKLLYGSSMKSPIRYFGGKGLMFKDIINEFPSEKAYSIFIEPFAGGASVLLQKPSRTEAEILNDLDGNIYALFMVLATKELFSEFKEKCDLAFYSHRLWNEFKKKLQDDNLLLVDRAFYYWYVNRTSRNSIGGFSTSVNTIRRGMSKSVSDFLSSVDGLSELHDRLSPVIIENMDALELIAKYKDFPNCFMYLDPPYSHETRTSTRYRIDFSTQQQKMLVDLLLNSKCHYLLSGYINTEYERLEKAGWFRQEIIIKTKDGNSKPKNKTEVLWRNYLLEAEINVCPSAWGII